MPENPSKVQPASRSILPAILIACVVSMGALWAYHNYFLRPWEVYAVDFRRVSDAKLAQLSERAMAGQATSMAELESFIKDFQAAIYERSQGRPVFLSGAVFGKVEDLTAEIADEMQIDLQKSLDASLSGMANRIGGSISRNMTPANSPATLKQ